MTVHRSKLTRRQAGDTLIEVLLATVIFSIVISASFTLVNRSSRINQVASERSEATNAMQTQAETLRFYRDLSFEDTSSTGWSDILNSYVQASSPTINDCANFLSGAAASPSGSNAFYFDTSNQVTTYTADPTGNVGRYNVWVEGFRNGAAPDNDYVDFYVHTCWMGPGGSGPQQASLVYRLAL